jgi:hypothetical protein
MWEMNQMLMWTYAGIQCRTEFCWDCLQLINRDGQYCGCNEFREGLPARVAELPARVAEPAAGRLVWAPGFAQPAQGMPRW